MTHTCIDYLFENKKMLLGRINKSLKHPDDTEDLFADFVSDMWRWTNPNIDMKEVPLYVSKSLTHKIGSYYDTKPLDAVDSEGEIKVKLTRDQLQEHQIAYSIDPLDHLMEEERKLVLPETIEERVSNPQHKELLHLILVQNVDQKEAADIVDLSHASARVVLTRFKKRLLA